MKLIISLLIGAATCAIAVDLVGHFWRGTTMAQSEVRRKWGGLKFNSVEFKAGSHEVRAAMASDILAQPKHFRGKTPTEIKAELGDPDGFYFRDSFPAYIISASQKESWQIVFLLDNAFKVSTTIVHKNCCSEAR